MFVIETAADIHTLRAACVLPASLLDQIESYLHTLHRQCGGEVSLDAFSLEPTEAIAILLPGDGPAAFRLLGLPDSLSACQPTWVGWYLCDGQIVYHLHIPRQEHGQTLNLYVAAHAVDQATTDWLAAHFTEPEASTT